MSNSYLSLKKNPILPNQRKSKKKSTVVKEPSFDTLASEFHLPQKGSFFNQRGGVYKGIPISYGDSFQKNFCNLSLQSKIRLAKNIILLSKVGIRDTKEMSHSMKEVSGEKVITSSIPRTDVSIDWTVRTQPRKSVVFIDIRLVNL